MSRRNSQPERPYKVIASRSGLTEHGLVLGVLAATERADGTEHEEHLTLHLTVATAEDMLDRLTSALAAARMGTAPLTRQ
jgi:hypothetical protein